MFATLRDRQNAPANDQLLKLYWNRAGVKRELSSLKRERFDLLDRLKEQEGEITRAQEQLEGLERLLTNPLAAANAMVYFQLRHMWRSAALRLEQFARELHMQRERRERAQLHEAALAKRRRRLDAISEKQTGLLQKRKSVIEECLRLEQRLERLNIILRLLQGPRLRKRIAGLKAGRTTLGERIQEFNDLTEKIQGEPLPEPEGLSLESRRLINLAIIAFAQHLVVHFSEHDLASLAKTSTERPVADMKFGDRRSCDQMVERIRERIEELKSAKGLPDLIKRRTDVLLHEMQYRSETDAVPRSDSVAQIKVALEPETTGNPMRRVDDVPLRINILEEDYWDLHAILR
jgi:hypothetical protein